MSLSIVRTCVPSILPFPLQDKRLEAVAYSRLHLAPWAPAHMPELQRVLATLAFSPTTKVAAYRALFSEQQWAALLELFHKELYRLHSLLPESQLTVQLQVGFAVAPGVRRQNCN